MPPFKSVPALQKISSRRFANLVSYSITSLANGSYESAKCSGPKEATSSSTQQHNRYSKPLRHVLVIATKEIKRIKSYIGQNIPKPERRHVFHEVLQTVTESLLKTESLKKKKKIATFAERISQMDEAFVYIFSVLWDNEITKIDFTDILHRMMKWVDTCRLNNMNPNEAGISYVQIETIFLKHFAENAKQMGSVEYISWPHLISGHLVRLIGRHLKNLKVLKLACTCETGPFIEEERKGVGTSGSQEDLIASLTSLFLRVPGDFIPTVPSGCPKLRKIILPNLDDEGGKAAAILADALISLPHLEYVSGISTLWSLEILCNKNGCPNRLSLKNINDYDPFNRRLLPEVDFLRKLIPRLESIELRVSKDLTKRVINQFPDVSELSLEWPDFHLYAKDFGSLSSLSISLDFQCPWPLLLALSRNCKQLTHLTLEHPTFQVDCQNLQELRTPHLSNLKFIQIIRSSFIEFTAFKTFVKGCPELSEINITLTNDRNYMVDEFNDQLIRAIAPLLKNLKRFTAECLYKYNLYLHMNCVLTIGSVYILMAHCPQLSFVGHLDSWDVHDREVKEFNKLIRNKNWDFELA